MEFQKFWKEKNRMCDRIRKCSECLMRKKFCTRSWEQWLKSVFTG
jgi:hypothetical protein